ncbi:MAG: DNA repair protein RecN, partial [Clostridia bacterium]|nr:DNA repair protein RecN [Clostridia bacterium]
PAKMDQMEARLDLIRRLERKYGDTIPEVLAAQEKLQEEYDRYDSMDKEIEQMGQEHKRLLARYRQQARALSASRHQLAEVFEKTITGHLRDLGIEKTVFSVAFEEKTEKKQLMPQPKGDDTIAFMISPNPGEPLKPLYKIASGGELSRIMLAIKSMEAEQEGVGCMVFDEIDTGISGRMAQVVGEKMALIARHRQVICVTHLPQIAAMADHEYLVQKSVTDGRTSTAVTHLDEQQRIAEIARMLGGAGDNDTSAKTHAANMLRDAQAWKKQQ